MRNNTLFDPSTCESASAAGRALGRLPLTGGIPNTPPLHREASFSDPVCRPGEYRDSVVSADSLLNCTRHILLLHPTIYRMFVLSGVSKEIGFLVKQRRIQTKRHRLLMQYLFEHLAILCVNRVVLPQPMPVPTTEHALKVAM